MAEAAFDELATILREMARRFGETAFTDRRRLVSLLSDRLPDSRRDIKVVAAAVDEQVFAALVRCRPEQVGMEIERLAANLENGLGIRSDVAVPVVRACAYGLGVGPLPSQVGTPHAHAPVTPRSDPAAGRTDSWVGLSEPVQAAQPAPLPVAQVPQAVGKAKTGKLRTALLILGPVVVVGGFLVDQFATPDQGSGRQQPAPQPVVQQPVVQQPVVPQPPRTPVAPPPPQPVSQPPQQPALPQLPPQANPVPQGPAPAMPSGPRPSQPQPSPQAGQPTFYGGENADFGVAPQPTLKADVGTPTPMSIPGANTVSTAQIVYEQRQNRRMLLIDALADAHPTTIAGAVHLPSAGQYGTFSDQVQGKLAGDLNTYTNGQRDMAIVFFCQGVRCWESYNAALRARAAGFPNVYWYRGGLQSWQEAGLPMQPLSRR